MLNVQLYNYNYNNYYEAAAHSDHDTSLSTILTYNNNNNNYYYIMQECSVCRFTLETAMKTWQ